jgi:hypothetical protein
MTTGNYWEDNNIGRYADDEDTTTSTDSTGEVYVPSTSSSVSATPVERGSITTSGSKLSPTGTTTTTTTKYSGTAPTLGDLPTYEAPAEWTGEQMAAKTQEKAALGLRQARQALRESTAGLGTDPASRLALKTALAQHGINIQGTMSVAGTAAENAESAELARKTTEAQTNFQAKQNYLYQTYQNEWNKYLTTGKTVSSTQNTYSSSSSSENGNYWQTHGYTQEDLLDSTE